MLSLANERTVLEVLREAVGSMLHSYPTSLVRLVCGVVWNSGTAGSWYPTNKNKLTNDTNTTNSTNSTDTIDTTNTTNTNTNTNDTTTTNDTNTTNTNDSTNTTNTTNTNTNDIEPHH